MLIDYDYCLNEEEHAIVRWMLESPLAKQGVRCAMTISELPKHILLANYAPAELAALVSNLPDKEIVVRRETQEKFPIFEFLLVRGTDEVPTQWSYRFTRKFLQFIVGRHF